MSPTLLLSALLLSAPPETKTSTEVEALTRRVHAEVVVPSARRERARFSRMAAPAGERRVRLTSSAPLADADGEHFYAFAIDDRRGSGWTEAVLTGCVYVNDRRVFVGRGARLRSASAFVGRGETPSQAATPKTCVAVEPGA
jgi:hypothetical protein